MNENTNPATQIATQLVEEARAYLADPSDDKAEALGELAMTPTIGARLFITYGGPTVEAVIETTRDEFGIVETTGRIEWSHGSETAAHTLTGEEAADLWEAYGLEGLANELADDLRAGVTSPASRSPGRELTARRG